MAGSIPCAVTICAFVRRLAGALLRCRSLASTVSADVGSRRDKIVICSYQFAAGKAEAVKNVAWDLVVVDEAHRLRNVYKPDNKTARTLRDALSHARKVLLTATPLQNSLLELYGLLREFVPGGNSIGRRIASMPMLQSRFSRYCSNEWPNTTVRIRGATFVTI